MATSHRTGALGSAGGEGDARRVSPSAERNKGFIAAVLLERLPPAPEPVRVLEVASGTGQHAAHMAEALGPRCVWQPTELDDGSFESVKAWAADAPPGTILPPVAVDVMPFADAELGAAAAAAQREALPEELRGDGADLVLNCNMIHISPWACTAGLFALAAEVLRPDGLCVLYGPFRVNGEMVESNQNFDLSLKSRDPAWGIRDLEAVEAEAQRFGFALAETVEMPANNLVVLFKRSQP